jgi:cation diffusion facilitator CzcD-associated flavoprotein CzcO
MLQRSPSYIVSLPGKDPIANFLRRRLPARVAYPIVRWKNVALMSLTFQLSRRAPKFMRAAIRKGVERRLPPGFDIDTHFNPVYDPWDQRMCLVPDGDLFTALADGDASVVTDRVECFTANGLKLASGRELEADVVITATGLNLLAIGGMTLSVDGREVELPETVGYKGIMFSGVPNLAVALGYTNASWTLKSDLTCQWVCRLLNHMDEHEYVRCVARTPGEEVPRRPMIDLNAGYVLRSIDSFPRQGDRTPWRLHQNYPRDVLLLRRGALEDGALEFSGAERQVGVTAA